MAQDPSRLLLLPKDADAGRYLPSPQKMQRDLAKRSDAIVAAANGQEIILIAFKVLNPQFLVLTSTDVFTIGRKGVDARFPWYDVSDTTIGVIPNGNAMVWIWTTKARDDFASSDPRRMAYVIGHEVGGVPQSREVARVADEQIARLRPSVDESTAPSQTEAQGSSVEERLLTIQSLRGKGLITDDEYESRRQAILG